VAVSGDSAPDLGPLTGPELRLALADSLSRLRSADFSSRALPADGERGSHPPPGVRPGTFDYHWLRSPEHSPVLALTQGLSTGDFTSQELVQHLLDAATDWNARLNVYSDIFYDQALAAARRIDRERRAGTDVGPLHGMPIAVKDVFTTVEAPTKANSPIRPLDDLMEDAAYVANLRSRGTILLGKTATMQLACGMPDWPNDRFVPRNPWQPRHWTGGSSSGSAAGVAAQLFPAALGTDTAGSIRTPAALCGVTGYKPSLHPGALRGCLSVSPTMDSVGPIGTTAMDCAVIAESLFAEPEFTHRPGSSRLSLADVVLGIDSKMFLADWVEPEARNGFLVAMEELAGHGVQFLEVSLPEYDLLRTAARVIWTTEAFTNFGRRANELARPTQALLETGRMNASHVYSQARRARAWGRDTYGSLLATCTAFLSPTRTCLAPLVEHATVEWQLGPHNHTSIWNLLGFPAISIPAGVSSGRLPIGLQLTTSPGDDRRLLAVAALVQEATDWHRATPQFAAPVFRTSVPA